MSTTTQSPQAGSKLPSEHDGFAIASLVTAFFLPILGIIFGHLSNHRAKLAHPGQVRPRRRRLGPGLPVHCDLGAGD